MGAFTSADLWIVRFTVFGATSSPAMTSFRLVKRQPCRS